MLQISRTRQVAYLTFAHLMFRHSCTGISVRKHRATLTV